MRRKLLIVTDGKIGHENQSKAFCSALDRDFDILRVEYESGVKKAFSYLADRLGVLSTKLFRSEFVPRAKNYDGVVCTGSTAFYPGKVLARKMQVPVCAILYPSGFRLDFDCILAPSFDKPPKRANLIEMPVNLTFSRPQYYKDAVNAFEQRHKAARPAVGIIIGGPNAFASMKADELKRQLDSIFELTGMYEKWVTTSRRTPPEVEEMLASYPFDYKLLYSKDHFNPIPAFVSLCDRLFVTADSTGMISEAVTQGKAKVEIINNISKRGSKFERFIQEMAEIKAAHIFNGKLGFASNKVDLQPVFSDAQKMLFPQQLEKQQRLRDKRRQRRQAKQQRKQGQQQP